MPQSYTTRGCQRGTWRSVSISVNGGPPPRPRNPGPRGRTFARRSSTASRCASSAAPSPARRPRSLPAWRDERNTRNFVLALRPRGYNSGMRRFRVSLAQINPTVGDVEGNTRRIVDGIAQARALGADLVAFPELAITGSPYHAGKARFRERMVATRAADDVVWLAFVNMVGGQDELVFDGASVIVDPHGETVARGRQFVEEMVTADLDLDAVFRARLQDSRRRKETLDVAGAPRISLPPLPARSAPPPPVPAQMAEPLPRVDEVFQALVLGTRDYVRKIGFKRVVIGLSGGIDSALVAAVAAEGLGRENVTGVTMPSPFSSRGTRDDARRLAKNLGIEFLRLPITPVFKGFLKSLAQPFKGLKEDVTEENIQARIRGTLLMALSNKFGWLVLTTGNKSEIAVGYSTLYGDMAGGFAVIKDVPKTLVYQLSRHVNARAGRPVIPQSVVDRAPSAELRLDQKDQDSLPPYPVLDAILEAYVEESRGVADLIAQGFDPAIVRKVVRMIDTAEYKRRQGPIGVKITPRAFGRDWRLPIVNRFREK